MKNIICASQKELLAGGRIITRDSHGLNKQTQRTVMKMWLHCHKKCNSSRDIAIGTHMCVAKENDDIINWVFTLK
jgi:hypothetical protein